MTSVLGSGSPGPVSGYLDMPLNAAPPRVNLSDSSSNLCSTGYSPLSAAPLTACPVRQICYNGTYCGCWDFFGLANATEAGTAGNSSSAATPAANSDCTVWTSTTYVQLLLFTANGLYFVFNTVFAVAAARALHRRGRLECNPGSLTVISSGVGSLCLFLCCLGNLSFLVSNNYFNATALCQALGSALTLMAVNLLGALWLDIAAVIDSPDQGTQQKFMTWRKALVVMLAVAVLASNGVLMLTRRYAWVAGQAVVFAIVTAVVVTAGARSLLRRVSPVEFLATQIYKTAARIAAAGVILIVGGSIYFSFFLRFLAAEGPAAFDPTIVGYHLSFAALNLFNSSTMAFVMPPNSAFSCCSFCCGGNRAPGSPRASQRSHTGSTSACFPRCCCRCCCPRRAWRGGGAGGDRLLDSPTSP